MQGNIIVLSGPSAVGKSRVIKELQTMNQEVEFIVSYTTRTPRINEEDGKSYHFVSEDEFEYLVESGQMIEWKKTAFGYYGTPLMPTRDFLLAGIPIVMDLDPQGFQRIKEQQYAFVHGIYLLPESLQILYYRLSARGQERGIKSQTDIDLRYQDAVESIRLACEYDMVLVNEKVLETAEIISQWIKILKLQATKQDIFSNWARSNGLPPA